MVQAIVLGVIGIAVGSAVFGRMSTLSLATPIPIEMIPPVYAGIVAVFLVSCVAASFLSLRTIFRIDPVSVFHN
jgi:putative ABC transport system permease protein